MELRSSKRPNYIPRHKSVSELKSEVELANSWRTPGPVNSFFQPPKIIRAKVLDPWTASRVDQPEKRYEKFSISKYIIITTLMA